MSATSLPPHRTTHQLLSLSCLRRADVQMRRHSIPLSPALFTRSAEGPLEGLVSPQFMSPVFLLTDHCLPTCPDPVGVAAHSCSKSFSCNTCGPPRKCYKQKTYGTVKPFGCNTYRKRGVGVPRLSTCRRSGVQTRVRSIPSIFFILQPYLHNGRCSIPLESIRYAHFSSRRRVYLPSPRFDPDLVGTFNLGLEAAVRLLFVPALLGIFFVYPAVSV